LQSGRSGSSAKIATVNLPVRLLAIDIDGTLLDPTFQVSAANLAALKRAHQAGIEIVLVTGRRHTFALPVADALGFEVALISSNGAVTKSSTGELFHRDLLPAATASAICGYMRDYRDCLVLTFDVSGRGEIVLEQTVSHPSIQRWMEKNAEYIEHVVPIERALTADPVQVMFCGGVERMRRAEARLVEGRFHVTLLKTQYVARDLCILDVLNAGCSKGHALERWARHRGFGREQVMAIGDNYNDVEMLEFAGVPVIMGNASEDLKQNGWHVTLGNDQSGVAAAVEQVLRI
jgi:Cof subfamily protein (haloacid dehalogenase superfamily)